MSDEQDAVIQHAQQDLAAVGPPGRMTEGSTLASSFGKWVDNNFDQLPSLGGELAAMFREGIKDLRQTGMEVFFSAHEHAPEIGAPLNPTQMQENQSLEIAPMSYGDTMGQAPMPVAPMQVESSPMQTEAIPSMEQGFEAMLGKAAEAPQNEQGLTR